MFLIVAIIWGIAAFVTQGQYNPLISQFCVVMCAIYASKVDFN